MSAEGDSSKTSIENVSEPDPDESANSEPTTSRPTESESNSGVQQNKHHEDPNSNTASRDMKMEHSAKAEEVESESNSDIGGGRGVGDGRADAPVKKVVRFADEVETESESVGDLKAGSGETVKSGETEKIKKRKRDKTKEEEEIDALVRDIEAATETDASAGKSSSKNAGKGAKVEKKSLLKNTGGDNEEGKDIATNKRKKKNKKKDNRSNNPVGDGLPIPKDPKVKDTRNEDEQNNTIREKVQDVVHGKGENGGQLKREADVSPDADESIQRPHSPSKKPKTKKKTPNESDLQQTENNPDYEMRSDKVGCKKGQSARKTKPKRFIKPGKKSAPKGKQPIHDDDSDTEVKAGAPTESQTRKRRRRERKKKFVPEKSKEEENIEVYDVDFYEEEKRITQGLIPNRRSPLKECQRQEESLNENKDNQLAINNDDVKKDGPNPDHSEKPIDYQSTKSVEIDPDPDKQIPETANKEIEENKQKTVKQKIDRLELMFSRLSPQQNILKAIKSDNTKSNENENEAATTSCTTPRSVSKSNKPELVIQEGVGITSVNTVLGVESGTPINTETTTSQETGNAKQNSEESQEAVSDFAFNADAVPSVVGRERYIAPKIPTFPLEAQGYVNRNNPNWEWIMRLQRCNYGMMEDTDWAFIYLDTSDEESEGFDFEYEFESYVKFDQSVRREAEGAESENRERSSCCHEEKNPCPLVKENEEKTVYPESIPKQQPPESPQPIALPEIGTFLNKPPGYQTLPLENVSQQQVFELEPSQTELSAAACPEPFMLENNEQTAVPEKSAQKDETIHTVGPRNLVCHPIFSLNNPHFVNGVEERIGGHEDAADENMTTPKMESEEVKTVESEKQDDGVEKQSDSNVEKVEIGNKDEGITENIAVDIILEGELPENDGDCMDEDIQMTIEDSKINGIYQDCSNTISSAGIDQVCSSTITSDIGTANDTNAEKVVSFDVAMDSVSTNEDCSEERSDSTLSAEETVSEETVVDESSLSPDDMRIIELEISDSDDLRNVENGDGQVVESFMESESNIEHIPEKDFIDDKSYKNIQESVRDVQNDQSKRGDSDSENKENELNLAQFDNERAEKVSHEDFENIRLEQPRRKSLESLRACNCDGNVEQCKCVIGDSKLTDGFDCKDITNVLNNMPKTIEKVLEGIDSFHEKQAQLVKEKLNKVCENAFMEYDVSTVDVSIELCDDDDTKVSPIHTNEELASVKNSFSSTQEEFLQTVVEKEMKTENKMTVSKNNENAEMNSLETKHESKDYKEIESKVEKDAADVNSKDLRPSSKRTKLKETRMTKESTIKECDDIPYRFVHSSIQGKSSTGSALVKVEKIADYGSTQFIPFFVPSCLVAEKPSPIITSLEHLKAIEINQMIADEQAKRHLICIIKQEDQFVVDSKDGSKQKQNQTKDEDAKLTEAGKDVDEKGAKSKDKKTENEKGAKPKYKKTDNVKRAEPKDEKTENEKGARPKDEKTENEKGARPKDKKIDNEKGARPKDKKIDNEKGARPKERRPENHDSSSSSSSKDNRKSKGKSKSTQDEDAEDAAIRQEFRDRAMELLSEEAAKSRDDVEVTIKKRGKVVDCVINLEPDNEKTAEYISSDSAPTNQQDDFIFKKPKAIPKISKRCRKHLRKRYQPPENPNEDPQAKEARLRQKAEISSQFRRKLSELQDHRKKGKIERHERPRRHASDDIQEYYTKDEITRRIQQRIEELSSRAKENDKEIKHIQRVLGRSDFPRDERGNVIPHCLHCGRVRDRLRLCPRCDTARYCSQRCLEANHPEHRDRCIRLHQWNQTQVQIPQFMQTIMARCLMKLVRRVKFVPDPWMEGCGRAIITKVNRHFEFFGNVAAKCEDMAGDASLVVFMTPSVDYYQQGPSPPRARKSKITLPHTATPIDIRRLLQRNMFLLILGAVWHRYSDQSVGIPITHMAQVYFIDTFCETKLRDLATEEEEEEEESEIAETEV